MIEMLVVFIVFGVSAMIATRSVGDTLRRDRVSKAAAVISADIEQAFALAARQRTPIRIAMNDTNRTFVLIDRADTTYKYRTRNFKTGEFSVDTIMNNRDSLDVMPNGLATDTLNLTLGIFTTGGSLYTKSIRVTRGGLVRVGNQ
jgi:Tfp pilus assembly protein FimT